MQGDYTRVGKIASSMGDNAADDSHPNSTFAARVAPYIGRRIVDVIEGAGDSGSIAGIP